MMDTWIILIVIYTGMNLAFCIWVLSGFLQDLPQEIEEAALVDGCNRFQVLTRIVVPVCAPSIASTAIIALIFAWNEFLFALILTYSRSPTIPILASLTIEAHNIRWGQMTAIGSITVIPVVVITFFIRKYILIGFTLGAVGELEK